MGGKFEIKKSKSGQFTFVLKAPNGRVILTSEQYNDKTSVKNGVESVKKNARNDSNYDLKLSSKGQHYFVLKAPNGQVIGQSEMYSSKSSMENGIESVKKNAPGAKLEDLTES